MPTCSTHARSGAHRFIPSFTLKIREGGSAKHFAYTLLVQLLLCLVGYWIYIGYGLGLPRSFPTILPSFVTSISPSVLPSIDPTDTPARSPIDSPTTRLIDSPSTISPFFLAYQLNLTKFLLSAQAFFHLSVLLIYLLFG